MSTADKIALTNLDVRIGNLFEHQFRIDLRSQKCCVVSIIGTDAHIFYISRPDKYFVVAISSLSPIVITPDFLRKNGFVESYTSPIRQRFSFVNSKHDFTLDFLKSEDDIDGEYKNVNGIRFNGTWFPCDYIHELQNLMYTLLKHKLA